MEWGILVIVIVIVYFIYRFSSDGIRKAIKIIGYQLNIKPSLVTECISNMRKDPNRALGNMTRQQYFCNLVVSAQGNRDQLSDPIKIFYIYQVLKNPHQSNVDWWADRISTAGFNPSITSSENELFQSFFDVDWGSFNQFVENHNSKFSISKG